MYVWAKDLDTSIVRNINQLIIRLFLKEYYKQANGYTHSYQHHVEYQPVH